MAEYTLKELNQFVGGKILGNPDVVVTSLSTNSRTVYSPEGTLFFAITGTNHDGHTYIDALLNKGVMAFVISDISYYKANNECGYIVTDNVLEALQKIAAAHRNRYNIPVMGITGSNGKTIVKEWLNYLLSSEYRITQSPKSYNSQIGVPLSVWQLDKNSELGIFEAGISMPAEMDKLNKIIRPDIGIFTNLGSAHQQNFESMEQKAFEKAQLFVGCNSIVWCADNPLIDSAIKKLNPHFPLAWSLGNNGNVKVSIFSESTSATKIKFEYNTKEFEVNICYSDKASIENAITCFVTCLSLNKDLDRIIPLFENLPIIEMRFEVLDGRNACRIINDSYSLDLNSLEIALDKLVSHAGKKEKVIIISDFAQNDQNEQQLYSKVAKIITERSINQVFGIGSVISAHKHLFPNKSLFFRDMQQFIGSSHWLSLRNAEILVKGARSFHFEEIVKLLQKQTHETVFEINLNAIESNLNYFRQIIGKSTKTMVMVKAFSYGSGYFEIASFLQYLKVDYLAVAYIDEGIDLRRSGIDLPIMVMNPRNDALDKMLEYNLEPVIFSFEILEHCKIALKSAGLKNYPVHIKIDTGMHRLGFTERDINELSSQIKGCSLLKLQSVFTHLVGSDDALHDEFTHEQVKRFQKMADVIADTETMRHILNSSGVLRFPEYCFDMVRIGIGLYGFASDDTNLIHTGRLKTAVSQLRKVRAGETIGYNRRGVVNKDSVVATIPIGYADGLNRHLGNGNWRVLINGVKAPIIGDICMDMTMVDVTGLNVREGDEVIVFGPELPVGLMAKLLETIPYEVLTAISQRVKRVYYQE